MFKIALQQPNDVQRSTFAFMLACASAWRSWNQVDGPANVGTQGGAEGQSVENKSSRLRGYNWQGLEDAHPYQDHENAL